jgi:hypothetical protein
MTSRQLRPQGQGAAIQTQTHRLRRKTKNVYKLKIKSFHHNLILNSNAELATGSWS